MIKTILVDDEVHCLDTLGMLLKEHCPQVQVVERCTSGQAALKAIERHTPALVFLDIEMPAMNGFELLEHYRELPFAVVFTTSYDHYAIRALHVSALDYLLKPVDAGELVAAVLKVENQKRRPLPEQFQVLQQGHRGNFTKLAVPVQEGYELIPIDNIIRCEADDNYTHIYVKGQGKVIASRSLKEVEVHLESFASFVRVHHSHIINLNEVTRYIRGEGGYVVMSDGTTVNVSRRRKDALLKWF